MQHTLDKILYKPSDYKICKECLRINWYENESCCECGTDFLSNPDNYDDSQEAVDEAIQKEYDFWINEEGYTKEEADNMLLDV